MGWGSFISNKPIIFSRANYKHILRGLLNFENIYYGYLQVAQILIIFFAFVFSQLTFWHPATPTRSHVQQGITVIPHPPEPLALLIGFLQLPVSSLITRLNPAQQNQKLDLYISLTLSVYVHGLTWRMEASQLAVMMIIKRRDYSGRCHY